MQNTLPLLICNLETFAVLQERSSRKILLTNNQTINGFICSCIKHKMISFITLIFWTWSFKLSHFQNMVVAKNFGLLSIMPFNIIFKNITNIYHYLTSWVLKDGNWLSTRVFPLKLLYGDHQIHYTFLQNVQYNCMQGIQF